MNAMMQRKINMEKYKLIALYGKSGAGKDTVAKATVSTHPEIFHFVTSCTTRPMRDGEKDGVDYYFLTEKEFLRESLLGNLLEATEFNGWFYGSSLIAFDKNKINIGVFNPQGILALQQHLDKIDLIIIEVTCSDKERLIRALDREIAPNCAEICRRYFADEQQWKDFPVVSDFQFFNGNGLNPYLMS